MPPVGPAARSDSRSTWEPVPGIPYRHRLARCPPSLAPQRAHLTPGSTEGVRGGITRGIVRLHGHDAATRRARDRGTPPPRRARRPVDAGGCPAGGPGLRRAHEQARTARPCSRRGTPPLRRGPRAPRPVIYLDLDDLLHVAARTLGTVDVRDAG